LSKEILGTIMPKLNVEFLASPQTISAIRKAGGFRFSAPVRFVEEAQIANRELVPIILLLRALHQELDPR
jgi:hypothetical protein